jgi:hypothetical protein
MKIDWNEWVGKFVFIKLDDGQFFSYSKILTYDEPFISLLDKFNLPAIINTRNIIKIREEDNGRI